MEKSGYSGLSERGKLMAEYIEIAMRYDIELARNKSKLLPGHTEPQRLLPRLEQRCAQFTDEEISAVVDLRRTFAGPRWKKWLEGHLQKHASDALELFMLEQNFGGPYNQLSTFIHQNYGALDRPWRMDHR